VKDRIELGGGSAIDGDGFHGVWGPFYLGEVSVPRRMCT
jgi:hypothetical protein